MFCELMIDPDQRIATASIEILLIMRASKKQSTLDVNASVRAHYHHFSCLNCLTVMSVRCVWAYVCACAWMCTPPMTAHQLCRYSDSAGAPLLRLLSSSWKSSLIAPKWNKWSPSSLPVALTSSWQLLSLLYWMTHFRRCAFSWILWASSQTKVLIQSHLT